jgi:hypothetical protein
MKRSHFFKILSILPFGASLPAPKLKAGSPGHKYLLNKFYVAGFQYYKGASLINQIKPGEQLKLSADPRNSYDRFAVAVYRDGAMLGHVPQSDNKHLSKLLRQGIHLHCNVIESNPDRETWKMLKTEVRL